MVGTRQSIRVPPAIRVTPLVGNWGKDDTIETKNNMQHNAISDDGLCHHTLFMLKRN